MKKTLPRKPKPKASAEKSVIKCRDYSSKEWLKLAPMVIDHLQNIGLPKTAKFLEEKFHSLQEAKKSDDKNKQKKIRKLVRDKLVANDKKPKLSNLIKSLPSMLKKAGTTKNIEVKEDVKQLFLEVLGRQSAEKEFPNHSEFVRYLLTNIEKEKD